MTEIKLPHQLTNWEDRKEVLNSLLATSINKENLKNVWPTAKNFGTLEKYITTFHSGDWNWFFSCFLPDLIQLALRIEELFPDTIQKLVTTKDQPKAILNLNKLQIGCLLSHCFLHSYATNFTFLIILQSTFYRHQIHKLAAIINYLARICSEAKLGSEFLAKSFVSFERRALFSQPEWIASTKPLSTFKVRDSGGITDITGALHIDFANENIGGHVLTDGMVQEEIHFTVHPECFISMLVNGKMGHNEVIVIRGAEKYSAYTGYGSSFNFAENYTDPTPTRAITIGSVEKLQKAIDVAAIDAVPYSFLGNRNLQWQSEFFHRELCKAYLGFDQYPLVSVVSTGNWGCGMFGGDKQWKALLQWLAASEAQLSIIYNTFSEANQAEELESITHLLQEKNTTVAQLYKMMIDYSLLPSQMSKVFSYIRSVVENK